MPILELQRRLREIGRIRIGEQVPASNGKTRPSKLTNFRFTSRDRKVVDAAADAYGGEVSPWTSPDGDQWEVKSKALELPCVVPPGGMAFSQWYELWSAGGCKRRCDGQTNHVSGKACICDPEARECSIHTRLSLLLTDLPGLGLWRLDTQGYYAAVELGGVVDLAAAFTERGQMLPARLRLEQRSVKREIDGKVQTFRFAVPTLDLDVHPLALVRAGGDAQILELPTGPSFQPVPVGELPAGPVGSIAEQLAAIEQPVESPRRKNAAAPIPATGIKPRTTEEAENDERAELADTATDEQHDALVTGVGGLTSEERQVLAAWWPKSFGSLKRRNLTADDALAVAQKIVELVTARAETTETVDAPAADVPPHPADETGGHSQITVKQLATAATKAFPLDDAPRGRKTKLRDQLRYALTFIVTNGEQWHMNELTLEQTVALDSRLADIQRGTITYSYDDDGATFTLGDNNVTVPWSTFDEQAAS